MQKKSSYRLAIPKPDFDAADDKYKEYLSIIHAHNVLVSAVEELKAEIKIYRNQEQELMASVNSINSILRRLGFADRITDTSHLGMTIINFLWKLKCSLKLPLVPDVEEMDMTPKETI